jgi:hypothetical protein
MKTYQSVALGVALSINVMLVRVFANDISTLVSAFERQAAVAVQGTDPVTPSSGELMGHLDPSRAEEAQ